MTSIKQQHGPGPLPPWGKTDHVQRCTVRVGRAAVRSARRLRLFVTRRLCRRGYRDRQATFCDPCRSSAARVDRQVRVPQGLHDDSASSIVATRRRSPPRSGTRTRRWRTCPCSGSAHALCWGRAKPAGAGGPRSFGNPCIGIGFRARRPAHPRRARPRGECGVERAIKPDSPSTQRSRRESDPGSSPHHCDRRRTQSTGTNHSAPRQGM